MCFSVLFCDDSADLFVVKPFFKADIISAEQLFGYAELGDNFFVFCNQKYGFVFNASSVFDV